MLADYHQEHVELEGIANGSRSLQYQNLIYLVKFMKKEKKIGKFLRGAS